MLNRARRVGFLLGICAVAAALAPAASQAPDPKKSLAQEQLGLARIALEALDQMHKNGQVSPDDPRIAVWGAAKSRPSATPEPGGPNSSPPSKAT